MEEEKPKNSTKTKFNATGGCPRLRWGGTITHKGKAVNVSNTCSMDNQLQILYYLHCLDNRTKDFLSTMASNGVEEVATLQRVLRQLDRGAKKKLERLPLLT